MFATSNSRAFAGALVLALVGIHAFPLRADDKEKTSEIRAKVVKALARDISMDFIEVPLDDVVNFFRDFTLVPITIDYEKLKKVKILYDHPITITVKDAKFDKALTEMLAPLNLEYKVTDTCLLITAKEEKAAPKPKEKPAEKRKQKASDQGAAAAPVKNGSGLLDDDHTKAPKVQATGKRPAPSPKNAQVHEKAIPVQTPAEALRRKVSCNFNNTPLEDVVSFLRDYTGTNLLLDQRGLDAASIQRDHHITLSVREVNMETMLDLMLRPLELTTLVHDEYLLITDLQETGAQLETRVYQVPDLVVVRGSDPKPRLIGQDLVELVVDTTCVDSWQQNGGDASIRFHGVSLSLVVRTTQKHHAHILKFLNELREAKKERGRDTDAAPIEAAVVAEVTANMEKRAKQASDDHALEMAKATRPETPELKNLQQELEELREQLKQYKEEAEKARDAADKARKETAGLRQQLETLASHAANNAKKNNLEK